MAWPSWIAADADGFHQLISLDYFPCFRSCPYLFPQSYRWRRPQQRPARAAKTAELDRADGAERPLDVAVIRFNQRIQPFRGLGGRYWAAEGYKCPFTGFLA